MGLQLGMVELAELESIVEHGYRRAGIINDDECLLPGQLIRARFGQDAIVLVSNLPTKAAVVRVNGAPVFAVRSSLSPIERRFCLGHEYAHVLCDEVGYRGDDIEAACDYIGAAIQTRSRVFRRAAKHVGANFKQLALDFGITETWAALRYGETADVPVAVVCPKRVRMRGPAWVWGEAVSARGLVTTGVPGVKKSRLTDDPKRVALVADAI